MSQILQKIIENKRAELARAKKNCPIESLRELVEISTRDFRGALVGGREDELPKIIAEIKRQSPSKKDLFDDLDIAEIVKIYSERAAAISILTDFQFFGGELADLEEANFVTKIPILRKDFIIDEYQILEARQFGADAVLLIARILEVDELRKFLSETKKLGMDALVEIHDTDDLAKILETPAEIVGVNSRNLDTLEIELANFEKLLPKIPRDKIVVAESGISTREDLEKIAGRADAALIGTALLQAENIESKLFELTS